jgi:DNA-binding SARP family transcriptional activator
VEWIESQSETVMLREEQIAIDVGRFGALIEADPRSALDLYTGPLLEGMALREQAFDDWLLETRRRLHQRACRGYEALAVSGLEGGDLSAGAAAARRLIELEPLREDAHRLLMRLQHAAGDRAGALQQYLRLQQQLATELGVAPSAETQRLHQSLREGSPPVPTAGAQIWAERYDRVLARHLRASGRDYRCHRSCHGAGARPGGAAPGAGEDPRSAGRLGNLSAWRLASVQAHRQ